MLIVFRILESLGYDLCRFFLYFFFFPRSLHFFFHALVLFRRPHNKNVQIKQPPVTGKLNKFLPHRYKMDVYSSASASAKSVAPGPQDSRDALPSTGSAWQLPISLRFFFNFIQFLPFPCFIWLSIGGSFTLLLHLALYWGSLTSWYPCPLILSALYWGSCTPWYPCPLTDSIGFIGDPILFPRWHPLWLGILVH